MREGHLGWGVGWGGRGGGCEWDGSLQVDWRSVLRLQLPIAHALSCPCTAGPLLSRRACRGGAAPLRIDGIIPTDTAPRGGFNFQKGQDFPPILYVFQEVRQRTCSWQSVRWQLAEGSLGRDGGNASACLQLGNAAAGGRSSWRRQQAKRMAPQLCCAALAS